MAVMVTVQHGQENENINPKEKMVKYD